MFKSFTTCCLLFVLLIAGVSCDTTKEGTTTTSSATEEKPVMEAEKPAPVGVPMKGDNYEIIVLNDTIKSPRKELRGTIGSTKITINYGSPAVNGRTLYGDLVPYGKVWRTGANEAAKITTSGPLRFGEGTEVLPAGTYGLFTMPTDRQNWTIIFNKDADQWGAYDYAEKMDVLRVATTSEDTEDFAERMDFTLTQSGIVMHWGGLIVPFEVEVAL